jgi:phosphate transport system substrate-binding protein
VSVSRISALGAIALSGALALSACASANPSSAPTGGASGTSGGAMTDCGTGAVKASGSTAQQNAIEQAIAAYTAQCSGAQVTYNGVGSGQGITDFIGKQTNFAGSDSALNAAKGEPDKAKASCGSEAWNLPMVTGPIGIIYNVKGVDKLVLTPELITKIFSGKITTWNDPAIAKVNSGVTLPSTPISVFFRSDSSGTTDNFTNYMNTVDPANWPDKHSKSWTGKVGQGKAKSAGVGQAVQATDGGIGYDEWSYAIVNNLKTAEVDSGSGPVALSADSAGKAIAAAKQVGMGNDLALKIDYKTKAPGAYPIILATYEIVCSKYPDQAAGKNVKAFLAYMASDQFQSTLTKVGSAPLPSEIMTKVQGSIKAIS